MWLITKLALSNSSVANSYAGVRYSFEDEDVKRIRNNSCHCQATDSVRRPKTLEARRREDKETLKAAQRDSRVGPVSKERC